VVVVTVEGSGRDDDGLDDLDVGVSLQKQLQYLVPPAPRSCSDDDLSNLDVGVSQQ